MSALLDGIRVIDFSQFLAGPMATLRLADLGAEVIKIERPGAGDLSRSIDFAGLDAHHSAAPFRTINRNKSSFAADLKKPEDLARVLELIDTADVIVENFRPGVADRLGLGAEQIRGRNPSIIYASFTGYGSSGPWSHLPGQDLLVQAKSGLMWMSGNSDMPPVPVGVSIVDIYGGALLAQGILAALIRKFRTGHGTRVETSLIEAAVDMQFQEISTFLNTTAMPPRRSRVHNGHPYLPAPYGVYAVSDGWIALAMMPLDKLATVLGLKELGRYADPDMAFQHRDEVKTLLAAHLSNQSAKDILPALEAEDIWCAEVLEWDAMLKALDQTLGLTQTVIASVGESRTTTCPIRIDGERLYNQRGAPEVGDFTNAAIAESPEPG